MEGRFYAQLCMKQMSSQTYILCQVGRHSVGSLRYPCGTGRFGRRPRGDLSRVVAGGQARCYRAFQTSLHIYA